MTTQRAVTAIGALVDPIRRSLYEYISARHGAVSREEAAAATQISLSKAKFHLDRLEKDGLLIAEQRRLTGRTGPGAGRPAKLYRRSSEEVSISLPDRRYDVVGTVLAAAIESAGSTGDLHTAINASAYARGAIDAQTAAAASDEQEIARTTDGPLARAERTLSLLGYEAEAREQEIVLHNCPFDALAAQHRTLVCAMNKRYVQGALDTVGSGELESCLAPAEGYCCVVARGTAGDAPASERRADGQSE